MALTTLIVCEAGDEKRQQIETLVRSHPEMQLVAAVSRHEAGKQISEFSPRLVWIELAPEPMKALTLLGDLREQHPKIHYLVSNETLDASLLKTSMQLGAADFLDAQTWQDQMPDVINRIMAKEQAQPAAAPQKPVFEQKPKTEHKSFFGSKKEKDASGIPQPVPAPGREPQPTPPPAPPPLPVPTPAAPAPAPAPTAQPAPTRLLSRPR